MAIAWLPGPAGTRRRVAKPSVEEPDAAEPARPDLWGARVSNDPGLPDRSSTERAVRQRATHRSNVRCCTSSSAASCAYELAPRSYAITARFRSGHGMRIRHGVIFRFQVNEMALKCIRIMQF